MIFFLGCRVPDKSAPETTHAPECGQPPVVIIPDSARVAAWHRSASEFTSESLVKVMTEASDSVQVIGPTIDSLRRALGSHCTSGDSTRAKSTLAQLNHLLDRKRELMAMSDGIRYALANRITED